MKDFGRAPGRLATLDPAAKAVYTLWMTFALLHFASSMGMYWDRTIRDVPKDAHRSHLGNVAAYYAGDEEHLQFPRPFGRLMEITHQHLFAMPLTLLVASHLFQLTRRSRTEKTAVTLTAVAAMSAHVAAPWIVRFGGEPWAWVMPVTGVPFAASF
ncbi:MAG TPA: hypothetical protein VMV18_01920, partial [bacterium]|nr:hypothetical protein [bacterium]